MLQPIMHTLSAQRIVLASGSPRRKQILENIGLAFKVIPSTFEENLDKSSFKHPCEYVLETSKCKALEVARKLAANKNSPDLVIGADTIVTLDGTIYEKPKDKDDAFDMLSKFSGKSHTVYTGVILVTAKQGAISSDDIRDDSFNIQQFYEATDVTMSTLSPEVIRSYIDTGEPMDKAGGYGIQAIGGTLVEGIKGDYFNVMGFPLHRFSKELYKMHSAKTSEGR